MYNTENITVMKQKRQVKIRYRLRVLKFRHALAKKGKIEYSTKYNSSIEAKNYEFYFHTSHEKDGNGKLNEWETVKNSANDCTDINSNTNSANSITLESSDNDITSPTPPCKKIIGNYMKRH